MTACAFSNAMRKANDAGNSRGRATSSIAGTLTSNGISRPASNSRRRGDPLARTTRNPLLLGDAVIRQLEYAIVTRLQLKHAGIILAAGASSRMGSPKALLHLPDGRTLAEYQADLLSSAGIDPVCLVLGHGGAEAASQLPANRFRIVQNSRWATGRLSSLQAGLAALEADGYLIIPVDSAGIDETTIRTVISKSDEGRTRAVRPEYQGKAGRILWLNHELAVALLKIPSSPSFRLDAWICPFEQRLPVDDPGILNNVNTPEDWRRVQPDLA